jgi:MoxR-like ATPase
MNLTVVRSNIEKAIDEMALVHKERLSVIQAMWVALIARQHMLFVGSPGTGKSMLSRDGSSRIIGVNHFEMAVDETSDPGQLVGPNDVVGMKDRFEVDGVPHGNWVDALAHARLLSDGDDEVASGSPRAWRPRPTSGSSTSSSTPTGRCCT